MRRGATPDPPAMRPAYHRQATVRSGRHRRRTARTRQREHGNPSTKRTRRTRNANPPSSAHNRDSTGQTTDYTLTRIAPEQQRRHQQTSRRQLKRHARARDNNDRSRHGHNCKQPKHEARTRTMSSHDGNIQTTALSSVASSTMRASAHERGPCYRRTSRSKSKPIGCGGFAGAATS